MGAAFRVVTGVWLRHTDTPHPELFLARRAGQRFYQGCWETPGGKVEPGESDEQALSREFKEELGFPVTVGAHLFTGEFVTPTGQVFDIAAYAVTPSEFLCAICQVRVDDRGCPDHGQERVPHLGLLGQPDAGLHSHDRTNWFPFEQALEIEATTPSLRPLVHELRAKKERSGIHILPSNEEVHFDDPTKTRVLAYDLAQILHRQCRYAGLVDVTVLEHLALCVRLAEAQYGKGSAEAAYVGAHDLHEAYLPDVTRPMKRRWPGYRALEDTWERYVHHQLGLQWPLEPGLAQRVKAIDDRAPVIETAIFGASRPEHYAAYHGGLVVENEKMLGYMIKAYRELSPRALAGSSSGRLWRIVEDAISAHLGKNPFQGTTATAISV